jgi:hypothetical protein
VFVDDAVLGRFPRVCAATGRPSDGWTTIHAPVGGSGLPGWARVLLFLGPAGWGVFLLWCVFGAPRERLDVTLPWTEAAHLGVDALRRRHRVAMGMAAVGGAALIAVLVVPVGSASMAAQVLAATVAVATVVAAAAAIRAKQQIWKRAPTVDLDASRRWVTLGNVDPAFARAAAADQATRLVPR